MKLGETKEYKLAGNPCGAGSEGMESVIEVSVNYQKEAYVGRPRGYYLSANPIGIKRENGYSVNAFTIGAGPRGTKVLLLEVARQSPKAERQAIELGAEKEAATVAAVLSANGMTLAVATEAA